MSYILDALKRSEQERHQGELSHTTIDTIMMPKKQVSQQWWPYVLIAILCLNVFIFLYFQLTEENLEIVEESLIPSKQKIESENKEIDTSKLNKSEYVTHRQKSLQRTSERPLPAHLMQTPKLEKRYERSNTLSSNETKSNQVISSEIQEVEKVTLNGDGYEIIRPKNYSEGSLPLTMPKAREIPRANGQASTVSEPINNYQESEKIQQGNGSAEDLMVEQAEAINFDAVAHINDMATAFQKQIPDIRFNSHIYSLNPSDRRVMINDLYLREGQDFSGVKIETIGEFYIILSKKSQRFKIPVLRDWYRPN